MGGAREGRQRLGTEDKATRRPGERDRRALKNPAVLRAGAIQTHPALRVSAGFYQRKSTAPYARPLESIAARRGLSEGNCEEPWRRLSRPRNLLSITGRLTTLFPGLFAGRTTALATQSTEAGRRRACR